MSKKQFGGVSELSKAGKHRRDDAEALFGRKRWRGAMYLAGYAVECLLKVKLMRRFRCQNLDGLDGVLKRRGLIPEKATVYDHSIELYLRALGGLDALRSDRTMWGHYNVANGWVPSSRYSPDLSGPEDAEDFLIATDALIGWVENNT
jgi:hypothetical protein